MKSIVVKCPECNAALEAGADTREVRCTYCGTLVVIQRRTGILQRPQPLPPRPPDASAAQVATEGRKVVGAIVGFLVIVVLAVLVPNILCNPKHSILKHPIPNGATILVDVNGDSVADLVSSVQYRESKAIHIAAFDGQSGKELWRSEELRREANRGLHCAAEGIVIDGKGAALNGINLKDGEIRWKVRLDEAVKTLCVGDDASTVRVLRVDKKAQLLSLSNGAVRAATSGACVPLNCPRVIGPFTGSLEERERRRWQAELSGMKVEKALEAGKRFLALGHKTPGTAVPLIALVQPGSPPDAAAEAQPGDFTGGHGAAGGPKVLWRSVVPAGDPLSAKGGTPWIGNVALGDKVAAVAYGLHQDSRHRLAVFTLADGKRRYDVALPKEQRALSTVLVTPRLVIVTSYWGVIAAFDARSGKKSFTID